MVFKQKGSLAGVEIDLARALADHLKCRIEFVELPWEDQIEALNAGKTDIIMSSMSITRARQFVVNFSRPYFVVGQMALVRREQQSEYALGFPVSPKGTIGVLKATTGEFQVQRDFPKSKRKVFTSADEAAKALIKKKIDLFVSDSSLIWYLGGTYGNDGLSVVPMALSEEPLAWAMRKTDEALLQSVNEFLNKHIQDGQMLQVFRRWTAVGN
jgi:polar amino acid transport system substrate-binding protein